MSKSVNIQYHRKPAGQRGCDDRSALHVQIHQLGRHHAVVQIGHDPLRPGDNQDYDEHTKRERQYVVGIIWPGGDVQEEHQMHSHLSDGQDHKTERNARTPEEWRIGNPEGRAREDDGESKSGGIDEPAG
jgi:hypothetical protein